MKTTCFIVEKNSSNKTMFEQLDDYGFDYYCDEHWPVSGYIEIYIDYYPHEIQELENIMKWYV